jgi:putative lipoprotein (rSAM/lipoprotein system)
MAKIMKKKYLKIRQLLSKGLLTALGFSACALMSCDNEGGGDIGGEIMEYGCPSVSYTVIGKVSDTAGKPIKGIQVIKYGNDNDTTVTDANGSFAFAKEVAMNFSQLFKFNDIDGDANGAFRTDSATLKDIKQEQIAKGDGKWYGGEYKLTLNKTLKKTDEK